MNWIELIEKIGMIMLLAGFFVAMVGLLLLIVSVMASDVVR